MSLTPPNAFECGIQDVCRQFGLTPRAVRFYEEKGLIQPQRNRLNTRRYSSADRAVLAQICRLRSAGVPIRSIQLLLLRPASAGGLADKAAVLSSLRSRLALLEEQIAQTQSLIAEYDRGGAGAFGSARPGHDGEPIHRRPSARIARLGAPTAADS